MDIKSIELNIFNTLIEIKALNAKLEMYENKLVELKKESTTQKSIEAKSIAVPAEVKPTASASASVPAAAPPSVPVIDKQTFASTANMPGLPTSSFSTHSSVGATTSTQAIPSHPTVMQSVLPQQQTPSQPQAQQQQPQLQQQQQPPFMGIPMMPQQQQHMPHSGFMGMPQQFQPGQPFGAQPNYGIPSIGAPK